MSVCTSSTSSSSCRSSPSSPITSMPSMSLSSDDLKVHSFSFCSDSLDWKPTKNTMNSLCLLLRLFSLLSFSFGVSERNWIRIRR